MADGSTTNFDAELTDAEDARGLGAKLRSFAKVNPRFAPNLASAEAALDFIVKAGEKAGYKAGHDVMLALDRPERISALNVLPAVVRSINEAPGATDVLVQLDAGGDGLLARVTRRTVVSLSLAPGTPLWAVVKAVSFDRANPPERTPAPGAAPSGIASTGWDARS